MAVSGHGRRAHAATHGTLQRRGSSDRSRGARAQSTSTRAWAPGVGTTLSVILLSVSGCGKEEKENEGCSVELSGATQVVNATTNEMFVTLRGDLSDDCKSFYTDSTGSSKVRVFAEADKNEALYFKELNAGNRTAVFSKENQNFKLGTVDFTLTNQLYPAWAYPWADKPGAISLTIAGPKDLDPSLFPKRASVELMR